MDSEFRFYLEIGREKYLRYYSGEANAVQVYSDQGTLIQFPVSALKPWVTHQGIYGYFLIRFDQNNKLIELKKLR